MLGRNKETLARATRSSELAFAALDRGDMKEFSRCMDEFYALMDAVIHPERQPQPPAKPQLRAILGGKADK